MVVKPGCLGREDRFSHKTHVKFSLHLYAILLEKTLTIGLWYPLEKYDTTELN